MSRDEEWMARALSLARLSEGYTRPNPPVGAVIVKEDRVIGEGRHLRAGGPHAEVEAFNHCAESAVGATLYVTLEPCCTTGRTPPCTERILKEKIRRVVVGCTDENAKHAGKGLKVLQDAGVEVTLGVCEKESRELVLPFFKRITTGSPFVTLKMAMTLDGRIADRENCSKWITSEASRAAVQEMRRRADAVMVGAGTVCADNPSLLYRGTQPGGEELLRVVVDARGRIPADARVLTDEAAERTIVATLPETAHRLGAVWSAHGASVWEMEPDAAGNVSLPTLCWRLGQERGLLHLLCEGGGRLAGALHDARCVDEYALFYAPLLLGDSRAVSAFSGKGDLLSDVTRLQIVEQCRFDNDLLFRLRP